MTNNEINRYIHEQILGKCVHQNVRRNDADPLNIDCADCRRTLTQREYCDENWDCRHSELLPQASPRICKHCGADDVSFDLPIKERPDYCSDSSPRSLLNAVVTKVTSTVRAESYTIAVETQLGELELDVLGGDADRFCVALMSATAEQIARACVAAHQEGE